VIGIIRMPKYCKLENTKFGKLTVIRRENKKKWGEFYWFCQCDCGKHRLVLGSRLKRGLTKHCGCAPISKVRKGYKDRELTLWKKVYASMSCGARQRKIKMELSLQEVIDISRKSCFYCGRPNSLIREDYISGPNDYRKLMSDKIIKFNGIDQIKAGEGYKSNNVVSCCKDCNRSKGTLSLEEFGEFLSRAYLYMLKNYPNGYSLK
jgi:5-methylcytosine-specific restriction endonuclease McrA